MASVFYIHVQHEVWADSREQAEELLNLSLGGLEYEVTEVEDELGDPA